MGTESLILSGRHVRLEPLEHRHIDGLVAAAGGDAALYQWSPVPRGKTEATGYVDTALAWRDAGSAVPFAIVRLNDGVILGSTRFWNLERWAWPQGHASHGRNAPDACEIGYTWLARSAIRTAANTEAKLLMLTHAFEDLAGAPRLLSHRRAQPALPRRARTYRRTVRRDSPRSPHGRGLHLLAIRCATRSWRPSGPP